MKKNLLSILILALLIVNIVLTSIMMFSVTGASKKTTALVTDIASVLKLELGDTGEGEEIEEVPLKQADIYQISEPLTITLKDDGGGKERYCILSVALSMNMKDKGYKTFGDAETMASYQPLITSEIMDLIGGYTLEEIREPEAQETARKELLRRIQTLFDSKFIYNVSFSDIKFQ